MKILHAEYGGLVIYNMRLESGTFRLSDIDREESSASLSVNWSELTLMVRIDIDCAWYITFGS